MKYISNPIKLLVFILVTTLPVITYYILKPEKSRDQKLLEQGQKIRELQAAGKNEQAMKLYQEMMADAFKGKVKLAGNVVDAQSKPLSGVEMTATTIEPDMSNHQNYTQEATERHLIDGSFEFSCNDCIGATLTFKKEGYYREKYEAAVTASRDLQIIKLDEQVVMQKRGELITGERYKGKLEVSKNQTTVLPLSFGHTTRAYTLERVTEMAKEKKHESEILYLEFKVKQEANGEVAVQPKGKYYKQPIDPVLDFTHADGGVIPYEPENSHYEKIDLEMKRAPVEGYQTVWNIDVNNMGTNGSQYFYCRIGGHYCRGRIGWVDLNQRDEGNSASLSVSIELNPAANNTNLEFY